MVYSEHSPIRSTIYRIRFEDIPSWVATHFARHNIGAVPFVSTQRPDRTDANIDRKSLSQSELVNLNIVLNSQSWINISRKRLCSCASAETTYAWLAALNELNKVDPQLKSVCVKECIYRGFCPELNTCGYYNTSKFINFLYKYRDGGPNGRKKSESQKTKLNQSGIESGIENKQQVTKNGQTSKNSRKNNRKKSHSSGTIEGSTTNNKNEQLPTS